MFSHLSERLNKVVKNLTGQGRLTESNIEETLREIRVALLEADVALPVIKDLLVSIREKALGKEVIGSLTPGQALIKIVHDELVEFMGATNEGLNLVTTPPAVILMAGLQGSGKTTTVAKLAVWLKQQKKSVLLVSTDVYRPAAIQQLETLAASIDVPFYPSLTTQKPADIVGQAIREAKNKVADVLLIDTAGRLHIDTAMMEEIRELHNVANPIETLFVVDSMTGQDAVNTAKIFNDALPLTGVILTKTDGDARGGAALSIRHVTGKPIKFLGVGEKTDALEVFHPERIVSRILGMGDVLSLVEEVTRKIDTKNAEKLAQKLKKGKPFDLTDYRDQLRQLNKMGGMANILSKLPKINAALPPQLTNQFNDKKLLQTEAIINSMTPKERRFPAGINHSQKKRIAAGSGRSIQEVNQLLKQFNQLQKMMKKVSAKGGITKLLRGLPGGFPFGKGGLPPGGGEGWPF